MRRLAPLTIAVLALFTLIAAPAGAQRDKSSGLDQFLPPAAPAVANADESGEVVTISPEAKYLDEQSAVLIVTMNFAEGWHAWPSADQDVLPEGWDFAIRTAIDVEDPEGVIERIGPIQWPEPHDALVPDISGGPRPVNAKAYSDKSVIFVPLVLKNTAQLGMHTINVTVTYQACDESMCMQPEDVALSVQVGVTPGLVHEDWSGFEGFDPAVFERMRADATLGTRPGDVASTLSADGSASGRTFFGIPVTGGILVLALLAAVGGLILNLTPCVLPVIPIKVMTISHHAGSPGKSLFLGLWMAAGVIAFWISIGLPAALFVEFADPSRIFGIWWVTLGIGLLIGAMGVGIMGLFQINLPKQVYAVNPKADSAWGSFLFGVMTGVLGLPCFGFVAGALLAGAANLAHCNHHDRLCLHRYRHGFALSGACRKALVGFQDSAHRPRKRIGQAGDGPAHACRRRVLPRRRCDGLYLRTSEARCVFAVVEQGCALVARRAACGRCRPLDARANHEYHQEADASPRLWHDGTCLGRRCGCLGCGHHHHGQELRVGGLRRRRS